MSVQPRVLVVDDDHSARAFVCEMLKSLGYETDDVEGGVQGLALLERLHDDIIITDLRMPNMSGWDVLKAVRGRLWLSAGARRKYQEGRSRSPPRNGRGPQLIVVLWSGPDGLMPRHGI